MKRNSFLDSLLAQQSLKPLFLWPKSEGTKQALTFCHDDTQDDRGEKKASEAAVSLHLLFITLYVFKGGKKKIKEKLLIV